MKTRRSLPITSFARTTAPGTVTVFLLIGPFGPGSFQDSPARKAKTLTWERIRLIWCPSTTKQSIDKRKEKDLWGAVRNISAKISEQAGSESKMSP